MKVKTIPSTWITREGRRLDCGPFMSGALEARVLLAQLSCCKDRLQDVTRDGIDGIVNAGRVKRLWVDNPEYGIPFLSSADILQADLSNVPLISNKVVSDYPQLVIHPVWTLITRSGTIGRMVYARPDMDGMGCSEHVMRVIPDTERIPSGYLYAFLSSKFGVPMVVGGTYGSIIQSIEPHHIADLPVPRLGDTIEQRAHALVEEAASLRTLAVTKLQDSNRRVVTALEMPPIETNEKSNSGWSGNIVSSSELRSTRRFEGYYYNPVATRVEEWARRHEFGYWLLGDIADVFDVPPFKHIYVEPGYGPPFFTSGDLFNLDRVAEKCLSKTRTRNLETYVIQKGWVLLARSGQLGGIIGRPQFADSALHEATTSDHVIRIVPNPGDITPGYLFAYLATSEVGYPLLTRTMTGASVPALWPLYLKQIPIVRAPTMLMNEINSVVQEGFELRVKATQLEAEARQIVEQAIEGAA